MPPGRGEPDGLRFILLEAGEDGAEGWPGLRSVQQVLSQGCEDAAVESAAEGDTGGRFGAQPAFEGSFEQFAHAAEGHFVTDVGPGFLVEVPVAFDAEIRFGGSEAKQVGGGELEDALPEGQFRELRVAGEAES